VTVPSAWPQRHCTVIRSTRYLYPLQVKFMGQLLQGSLMGRGRGESRQQIRNRSDLEAIASIGHRQSMCGMRTRAPACSSSSWSGISIEGRRALSTSVELYRDTQLWWYQLDHHGHARRDRGGRADITTLGLGCGLRDCRGSPGHISDSRNTM